MEVNIPLIDAIKQVSRYAKFIKDLCTNKRKISGYEVSMGKNVSAVLQEKKCHLNAMIKVCSLFPVKLVK